MHRFSKALGAILLGAISLFAAGFAAAQPSGAPPDSGGITPANVGALKLVFSFRTGAPGSLASPPGRSGGLLFLLTPFPHTLFALDPARPNDPVRWRYAPPADDAAQGLACCERMANGPIVADGRVYFTTLDGHVLALDGESGAVAWSASPASPDKGEALTNAPLVADGKVFIGSSGDEYGARGWIAALDQSSGKELWRKFSAGPDSDVGIGPDFQPYYAADRGRDLGVATWPPSAWEHGGGSVSGPILYDAAAKLLIHGTGRPAPWNPDQRTGDDKWTSGLFARDAESGAARWFDPLNPHDLFALGGTGPNLLLDTAWRGAPRQLLLHLDENGYLYVVDRASGEILDAQAYAPGNAATGVDLKTGSLKRDPAKATRADRTIRDICPGWPGAINGAPALSADAKLIFIPLTRLCMDIEATNTSFIQGAAFIGAYMREKASPDGPEGAVLAWDFAAGKALWTAPEHFPVVGGVLATESGVLFYGTLDGAVKALDARTGRELWRFKTKAGIVSRPISYRGGDGKDYIAVVAGLGDGFDVSAAHGIDIRDATAAHGLANALRDLPQPGDPSGALYVFALP